MKDNKYPMPPNSLFKYSITTSYDGVIIEPTISELSDILNEAHFKYGIYMPYGVGMWETTNPKDKDDFGLFINKEDGSQISQEEHNFITALMNNGKYSENESDNEWIENVDSHAIGGIVAGTLIGGFLGYMVGQSVGEGKGLRKAHALMSNGGEIKDGARNYLGDLWFAVHESKVDKYKELAEKLDEYNVPMYIQNEVSLDATNTRSKKMIDTLEVQDRIKKILEMNDKSDTFGKLVRATMETPDGLIHGDVTFNNGKYQVTNDGVIMGEFNTMGEGIDDLERAGFTIGHAEYKRGGSVGKKTNKVYNACILTYDGRIIHKKYPNKVTEDDIKMEYKNNGVVVTNAQIHNAEPIDFYSVLRGEIEKYSKSNFDESIDEDLTMIEITTDNGESTVHDIHATTVSGHEFIVAPKELFKVIKEYRLGGDVDDFPLHCLVIDTSSGEKGMIKSKGTHSDDYNELVYDVEMSDGEIYEIPESELKSV